MELKRFIVTDKNTGEWISTYYAEEFKPYDSVNSFTGIHLTERQIEEAYPNAVKFDWNKKFTGTHGGHFWIKDTCIGSIELAKYNVSDSGGRSESTLL